MALVTFCFGSVFGIVTVIYDAKVTSARHIKHFMA